MSTEDPKPVAPTGDPRVDALIDAMICPACRTIWNAEKANCSDPWHFDNRPAREDIEPAEFNGPGGHLVSSGEFATAEHDLPREKSRGRRASFPDLPAQYTAEDMANAQHDAYAWGISEGRRQATEGWTLHREEEQWSVWWQSPGGGQNVSVPTDADDPEEAARAFQAEYGGDLKRRWLKTLESPWEPAEQPEDDPLWAAEQAKRAKLAPLADFVVRTADEQAEPRTRPRMTDGCGPEHTYRDGCELRPEEGKR